MLSHNKTLEVVRECLESAQALRAELHEYRSMTDVPEFNGVLGERLVRQEQMLTLLLAAVAYMAGGNTYEVLFNTYQEKHVEGIGGPDPWGR